VEEDEMAEPAVLVRKNRNVCRVLVENPEGKRPLRRLRGRREGNTEIISGGIG
jgi:hypothetical protein